MFTIKVQVMRNTANRPSTQASTSIGSRTTMQENQPAAQIAAKRMAPYMSTTEFNVIANFIFFSSLLL